MAWSTPITAAANSTFNASQWNSGVRDNLAMTAPAISTTNGWLICSSATNVISQREIVQSILDTSATTSSLTFVTIGAGPAVTVTTGNGALCFHSANVSIATNHSGLYGPSIDGDTPPTGRCILIDGDGVTTRDDRIGVTNGFLTLSDGSHTFTLQGRVTGGGPLTVINRRIIAMAL